eukprot:TRINITY_DN6267_c0_g4_i1.p1 TRINITY_DN6267_c0_g4~~TRINITY_DN6267_c0_g4_i1.p1  ORF type:complete len:328 (+),score=101.55 TRINITY_DN6267_c0_g4_i1:214-1197(+)
MDSSTNSPSTPSSPAIPRTNSSSSLRSSEIQTPKSSSNDGEQKTISFYLNTDTLQLVEENGIICCKGGTFEKIVEWLIEDSAKEKDSQAASTFIFAFRKYSHPETLLRLLIEHYQLPSPAGNKTQSVKQRVLEFLEKWLSIAMSRDFLAEKKPKTKALFNQLFDFIQNIPENPFLDIKNRLKLVLYRHLTEHRLKKKNGSNSNSNSSSSSNSSSNSFSQSQTQTSSQTPSQTQTQTQTQPSSASPSPAVSPFSYTATSPSASPSSVPSVPTSSSSNSASSSSSPSVATSTSHPPSLPLSIPLSFTSPPPSPPPSPVEAGMRTSRTLR